ncbi:acetylornithine transaminase [Methanococcus voltae]|uniref:Acetylornithine aminotransferase n=2 Tax=Methanococcus voltae TaxID=2188 RepID=A0A8J7S452_METVO|nr:acetylornithine transaminase [Methanococcus voltae]MBP2171910.1 acetylornithine/N-succinyldiaminopimelate aminotransferase [Methanococcus voltae]MBP2201135.1 acetylornithine/N-succinyldiaminopimelate aminotransferase [Methanococcus voltae]MCS3921858.1 acetylornithine/N-succinyldiaminopimelate aminotransferase [Methanococcus voltae PS]
MPNLERLSERTQKIINDESENIIHTYGRLPIVITKGEGMKVYDVDGNEYLDFLAGIAVNNMGHCHPEIVEALKSQIDNLMHISNIYYNIPQVELGKKLVELSGLGKSFFCNSGAEANEAAIKLARKYGKQISSKKGFIKSGEVISMEHSFHGRTLTTITATPKPKYQEGFEPLPTGFRYAPFNDIEALKEMVSEHTSAIIIEPVQGEGGIYPVDKEYLKEVRKICDELDIILIFDEVQCGMGRTGKMFAYENYEVVPDIVTLAKALGNGFPIGAIVAKKEVAEAFQPGSHGTTFGGNPMACATSLKTLELLENQLEHTSEIGAYFKSKLNELKDKYEFITEVRGLGLMLGIQLTINGSEFVPKMLEKGYLINCTSDTVLRFVPPLIVEKEHIDSLINSLDEIFSKIE